MLIWLLKHKNLLGYASGAIALLVELFDDYDWMLRIVNDKDTYSDIVSSQ